MRLITRSDFDGLVSAVLLKQVEQIDEIIFVHPKDVQDGKVAAGPKDILSNLPYVPGCGLWFDHHSSEVDRISPTEDYRGDCRIAPSAARVIFDFYGDERLQPYADLLVSCDKADSADLDLNDTLHPEGWILLAILTDARTGLGYHRGFRISNYDLMMKLIDMMSHLPAEVILQDPDVLERSQYYFEQEPSYRTMLIDNSRIESVAVVTDLRRSTEKPIGNRFMIHALYPETSIAVRVLPGKDGENTVISVAHSIFKRTSRTDIGKLMAKYGGGGHRTAGTCQVDNDEAERIIEEVLAQIASDG